MGKRSLVGLLASLAVGCTVVGGPSGGSGPGTGPGAGASDAGGPVDVGIPDGFPPLAAHASTHGFWSLDHSGYEIIPNEIYASEEDVPVSEGVETYGALWDINAYRIELYDAQRDQRMRIYSARSIPARITSPASTASSSTRNAVATNTRPTSRAVAARSRSSATTARRSGESSLAASASPRRPTRTASAGTKGRSPH
jgi:hypothetical protein